MSKMNIEDLLESLNETKSVVILRNLKTCFDIMTGKQRQKTYRDCCKVAKIHVDDQEVHLYLLENRNEHKEIVYPRNHVQVEQRANPVLVITGDPCRTTAIGANRDRKTKLAHAKRMLASTDITVEDARAKISYDKYTLPEVGIEFRQSQVLI